ncbi:PP2C family serine/threonine-protein phosphatase [Streptomyces sp. NPDC020875]|uniref:PP2C family serine/threonine-protein phosphatase n=1 Tax=Streptomyces sp. NPDC020875 TaxID=3154898 RepID=UPI0033DCDE0D
MIITTATASRRGTRSYNADATAVHRLPGSPMVAATVVDGIGNTPAVVRFSTIAAEVIARVGARRGPLLGILAAAEMAAGPLTDQVDDGVAASAVTNEETGTSLIAWTGDARIYGWNGEHLVQRSTDQTMGTWLRRWGGTGVTLHRDDHPDETVPTEAGARVLDDYARSQLAHCSIATVPMCQIYDRLIVLTSDGAHGQTTHAAMETLTREYGDDPQRLAELIVAAAEGDADGYRDDATAAVIRLTD